MSRIYIILSIGVTAFGTGCGGPRELTTPDGEKVTVAQDGEGVNITVKGEDGESVQISANESGVSLPDGFPSDVPIYPGATITLTSETPQGMNVVLRTKDPAEKVRQFYQEKLKAEGWEIVATMNMPTGAMLQAKKGERSQTVITGSDGQQTTISLTAASEGG